MPTLTQKDTLHRKTKTKKTRQRLLYATGFDLRQVRGPGWILLREINVRKAVMESGKLVRLPKTPGNHVSQCYLGM